MRSENLAGILYEKQLRKRERKEGREGRMKVGRQEGRQGEREGEGKEGRK